MQVLIIIGVYAIKLNPKNDLYYHTLGNCLRKLKKHKEAIQMYEKGKEIKKLNDNNNKFNLEKEENEKNNKNIEYSGEKKIF